MFAFALWDSRRETLFLARDRLGVKPLHYALLADGTLIFGSELKALLVHPRFSREIDPLAVEEYFALGYVAEPRTIFRAARKLPPAHTLTFRRIKPCPRRASTGTCASRLDIRLTEGEACEELRCQAARVRAAAHDLRRAARRLPVGRVDSSAVVATMAGLSADPVNTCSIAFTETAFDESAFADAVAKRYGTRHFTETRRQRRFRPDRHAGAGVRRALCRQLGDSDVPGMRARAQARDRRAVGRRRRRELRRLPPLPDRTSGKSGCDRMLPPGLRRPLFGRLGRAYPEGRLGAARAARQGDLRGPRAETPWKPTSTACRSCAVPMRQALFSERLRRPSWAATTPSRCSSGTLPARRRRIRSRSSSTSTCTPTWSATSTPRSIAPAWRTRSRCASRLMDHPLVEWLATLPSSLKIRGTEGQVPAEESDGAAVAARSPVSAEDGLRRAACRAGSAGRFAQRVREALLGDSAARHGILRSGRISSALSSRIESGARDYSAPLWTLLMFDAFLGLDVVARSRAPRSRCEAVG